MFSIDGKASKINIDLSHKYRYNIVDNGKQIVIMTLTFRATSRVLFYIPTVYRHQKIKNIGLC